MNCHASKATRPLENHEVSSLEYQFVYLRELLRQESLALISSNLEEARVEEAEGFRRIKEDMESRLEVAENRRKLRLAALERRFEAEKMAILQNGENEKQVSYDTCKSDLQQQISHYTHKILRCNEKKVMPTSSESSLETSDLESNDEKWFDDCQPQFRKPTIVSGPHVVYRLHDKDIHDDLSFVHEAFAKLNGALKDRSLQTDVCSNICDETNQGIS